MKAGKSDIVYLEDIRDAINEIISFLEDGMEYC